MLKIETTTFVQSFYCKAARHVFNIEKCLELYEIYRKQLSRVKFRYMLLKPVLEGFDSVAYLSAVNEKSQSNR